MTYEEMCRELLSIIPEEEKNRVFGQECCDIGCDFLGFIEEYKALSEIIPKVFTVIDFGAAYNVQSWWFRGHERYIAVQPPCEMTEMFCPPNCVIHRCTTGEFIETMCERLDGVDMGKVFAICNYVPNWYGESSIELVKKNFQNVFTFYPCKL